MYSLLEIIKTSKNFENEKVMEKVSFENLAEKAIDANGNVIRIGDDVLILPPGETDVYKSEFVGRVRLIRENGIASVINDGAGASYDIPSFRMEVLPRMSF